MKKPITFGPITLGLSLAALLAAGGAYAAQGQVRPKLDVNGDGVITRAEAQAGATARFARMDANNDGMIDRADRDLRREAMKTQLFDRLDSDRNGALSKAEFLNRDARSGGGRAGHRRGGHNGMMRVARMADADRNGAVTQAEFTSAALTRFDAMDSDRNGQVTQQERDAARARMKAQWQQRRAQKTQG